MALRFWTADLHLGHPSIVLYCKRPFVPEGTTAFRDKEHAVEVAKKMNTRLIANINERCKPEDALVHVGDFCTKGVAKEVEGLRLKYSDYLREIHCRVTLLEGNHDSQNGTKTIGRHLFTTIHGQSVFVSHYPTENIEFAPALIEYARANCAFAICGHVHDSWKFKVIDGLLNVNVGVDQWNYRPINDDELLRAIQKEKKDGLRTH